MTRRPVPHSQRDHLPSPAEWEPSYDRGTSKWVQRRDGTTAEVSVVLTKGMWCTAGGRAALSGLWGREKPSEDIRGVVSTKQSGQEKRGKSDRFRPSKSSVMERGEWSRADGWLLMMLLSCRRAAPIVDVRHPPSGPGWQPLGGPVSLH